jgi:hypothetical protein
MDILNSQPNVNVIDTMEDMFKDYGNMFDIFYSNFEIGTIRINHIFKVGNKDHSSLEIQCITHDGSNVVNQSMLNCGATHGDMGLAKMKAYLLLNLTPPGIR